LSSLRANSAALAEQNFILISGLPLREGILPANDVWFVSEILPISPFGLEVQSNFIRFIASRFLNRGPQISFRTDAGHIAL
jgi:hypothetical protein